MQSKNYENIAEIIREKLLLYKYTYPFSDFYENIVEYNIGDYHVYSSKFNNIYKINNAKKYDKYDKARDVRYSTSKIPVYNKQYPELNYIMNNDYYEYFCFGNKLVSNYNPNKYYHTRAGDYLITPTVTPRSSDVIITTVDNKKTAQFYYDYTLLQDMYMIWIKLNLNNTPSKQFMIYNSLETGSIPDYYHYHVQDISNPSNAKADLISETLIGNLYQIRQGAGYANMYALDISLLEKPAAEYASESKKNKWDTQMFSKIIKFFKKCRHAYNGKISCVYVPQIFFLKTKIGNNLDQKNYLFFSFRRAETRNIKVDDKGNMCQTYFDQLYGNSYENYGLIYLPIGIIMHQNSISDTAFHENQYLPQELKTVYQQMDIPDTVKKLNIYDQDMIDAMLNVYHFHPDIATAAQEINDYAPEYIIKDKDCADNLDAIANAISQQYNAPYSLSCYEFPLLYNIGAIKIFGQECNHGLTQIGGDNYYFIDTYDKKTAKTMQQFIKNNNLTLYRSEKNRCFPQFYLDFCFNETRSHKFIFSPVKTTLDAYIKLETQKIQKDPTILKYILAIVMYKMRELAKRNIFSDNLKVSDILVAESYAKGASYFFDNYNITNIFSETGVLSLDFLPFNATDKPHLNNYDLLYGFSSFLQDMVSNYNFFDHSLTLSLLDVIRNNGISAKCFALCSELLSTNNMVDNRTTYYTVLMLAADEHLMNIKSDNTDYIYRNIVARIDDTDYKHNFSVVNIKKGETFFSGTSNDRETKIYNYTEGILDTEPIIYAEKVDYFVDYLPAYLFRSLIQAFSNFNKISRIMMFNSAKNLKFLKYKYLAKKFKVKEMIEFFMSETCNILNIDLAQYMAFKKYIKKQKILDKQVINDNIQTLFNTVFAIKYRGIYDGYLIYNIQDKNVEYVIINPSNSFILNFSLVPTRNYYRTIDNIKIFDSYIRQKRKASIIDKKLGAMMLQDLGNSIKIFALFLTEIEKLTDNFEFYSRPTNAALNTRYGLSNANYSKDFSSNTNNPYTDYLSLANRLRIQEKNTNSLRAFTKYHKYKEIYLKSYNKRIAQ